MKINWLESLFNSFMTAKHEQGTVQFRPTPKRKGLRKKSNYQLSIVATHSGRHQVRDARIVKG